MFDVGYFPPNTPRGKLFSPIDAALSGNALYAARLRDVVEAIQPRALAFNDS
jgi:hypothetical protein